MNYQRILTDVGEYYGSKLKQHGPVPQGVDWNSRQSQELRFEQLLKVCDLSQPFSLNDYGCGYGSLVEYLTQRGCHFQYRGFDISASMIEEARKQHGENHGCEFFSEESCLTEADYAVASGIFNVRQRVPDGEWLEYVLHTVDRLAATSVKGFAFNALTKYSDADRMRPDLYYADPCFLFDYCKRHFSRHVALLHDYGLYEFTLIVRTEPTFK